MGCLDGNATLAGAIVLVLLGCGASAPPNSAQGTTTSATATPTGAVPLNGPSAQRAAEPVEVLLCDGQTKVTLPPGTSGSAVSGALMAEWLRKNPNSNWETEERERHTLQPAAENRELIGQVQGQTYGRVSEQDVALWKAETERVALAGSQVFHSAVDLGSTISVSCDMCHPHAANTHPETYPKFQAQLGRVALLRDMINWCIEHPVRGKPFAADDPKMRALEAYILAQRKGKTLEYGKH
jgi:thiosulfate dehydrogenase